MKISEKKILALIKMALKEDIGRGDITSRLVLSKGQKIKATITAKESGVICGLNVARLVFKAVDKKINFRVKMREGKKVKSGQVLAHIEGEARNILKAERVALNFLARLSGIATGTFKYIQRVKPYSVKIMDTRKTTPILRALEKYAVRCGGGFNHRLGLWDQILIKDNHLSAISHQPSAISLKEVIGKIKNKKPKGLKIEIEVKNLREFKQALEAKPDIIMLDNFSLKDIKKAVGIKNDIRYTLLRKGCGGQAIYDIPKLEVSGGVNLKNLRKIAGCGVDMISVGALTHSVKSLDLSLEVGGW